MNAFKNNNLKAFKSALEEPKSSPNGKFDANDHTTVFEKILKTPNSSEYIHECISRAANTTRVS